MSRWAHADHRHIGVLRTQAHHRLDIRRIDILARPTKSYLCSRRPEANTARPRILDHAGHCAIRNGDIQRDGHTAEAQNAADGNNPACKYSDLDSVHEPWPLRRRCGISAYCRCI
jgi:hypothetical protein